MQTKNIQYIFVAMTILLWSFVPTVAKLVLRNLNAFQVLNFTSFFAVLSLSFAVLFQKKVKSIKNYSRKQILTMILIGVLSPFIYYVLLFESFERAPVADAQILNYMWPIFVVIFATFILRQKLSIVKLTGIILSFFGAFIVVIKGQFSIFNPEYGIGYIMAILAAMIYGLFSVLGKKYDYERFSSMLVYYISTFVLVTLTVSLFSNFVIPSFWELLGLFYLGGIANSIGWVFWFKALQVGDIAKMSNLIYLVPFLSLIPVQFILNENIQIMSILGLLLIVTGILIQFKTHRK
jgi:drug/metabolite transporter (DMT)-like permease